MRKLPFAEQWRRLQSEAGPTCTEGLGPDDLWATSPQEAQVGHSAGWSAPARSLPSFRKAEADVRSQARISAWQRRAAALAQWAKYGAKAPMLG